jgi:hypothetical protein
LFSLSKKVCDACDSEVRRIPLLYFQAGKFLLGGNRKAEHYTVVIHQCHFQALKINTVLVVMEKAV